MTVVVNEFEVVPEPAPGPQAVPAAAQTDEAELERRVALLLGKRAERAERLHAS